MSSSLARDQTVPGPGQPPGPAARRTPAGRDAFFDNAKYLAIVLVVIGHTWEPLRDGSHTVKAAYMLVYSFHMPVMILVSGYMAKNFDSQPRRIKRLITSIAVPYVLFECAYRIYDDVFNDGGHGWNILDPWWLTWFMMAMFAWRMSAPIWRVLRWPIPIAILISFLGSLHDFPDTLEMNRTLELLPFFVVGMFLKREHFALLHRRPVRVASVFVFVCGFAVAYVCAKFNVHVEEFFFWRSGRDHFGGISFRHWFAFRVGTAVCAAVATAAFLSLVPNRQTWFTKLGQGTMATYLLHGFLVKAVNWIGVYDLPETHQPYGVLVLTVVAMGVATVLSTPAVSKVFKFAMDPELKWLFRASEEKRTPPAASPGGGDAVAAAAGGGTGARGRHAMR